MSLCKTCADKIAETLVFWLTDDYEGGVIGSGGHYDHTLRRNCPSFIFHWGIDEDPDDPEYDDEDE